MEIYLKILILILIGLAFYMLIGGIKMSRCLEKVSSKIDKVTALASKGNIKNVYWDGNYVYIVTDFGIHTYNIQNPEKIEHADSLFLTSK